MVNVPSGRGECLPFDGALHAYSDGSEILAVECAFPIPSKGPEPDIFFRLVVLPVAVVAPAPLGGSDMDPARCPVHGAGVARSLDEGLDHAIRSIEGLSHLVLAGAYFIAVAYYLVLLAAFGMKLLGWHEPVLGKIAATVLISGICGVGALKGLGGVERMERFTVSANLAAIAAMLAALAIFGIDLPSGYSWTAKANDTHAFDWDTVRFLMGLLIVVQGFETTRFMGQMYDPEIRIRAMKRAQITSSLIYLVFFVLMIPLFPYFTSTDDVAGLIDVIGRVTPWPPFVAVAGAIASQFSAAVADSIGAGGLISDTTHRFIDTKHAYLLIGAVSVFVIWETEVVSLVALASRAFALLYALQCVVAVLVAHGNGRNATANWFGLLGLMSFAVAVFGIPAEG